MRKLLLMITGLLFLSITIFAAGCTPSPADSSSTGVSCSTDQECNDYFGGTTYYCDLNIFKCKNKGGNKTDADTAGSDTNIAGNDSTTDAAKDSDTAGTDAVDTGKNDDDTNTQTNKVCNPGDSEKCPYTGPSGTENVGGCKAGFRACSYDGKSWLECAGEVLPGTEILNSVDDDCDGKVDNGMYDCDASLNISSKDPMDYARALGLCMNVVSVDLLKPDGTSNPNINSNSLMNAFGSVIKPHAGNFMLGLSSGKVENPVKSTSFDQGTSSAAPGDWYGANGNKYPSSPSCGGGSGMTGSANDCVMLKIVVKVPDNARSFSLDFYFLTIEYPGYICTQYNDFFVALLDSAYTNADPALQNPADKNLGRDANNNPVGVNLAPAGLFKQCTNTSGGSWSVNSCIGTNELQGTGFEKSGGTGWLTLRGNVVPGETITLRLAIWDLGDHVLDSMVLLDNFLWATTEGKTGIQQSL